MIHDYSHLYTDPVSIRPRGFLPDLPAPVTARRELQGDGWIQHRSPAQSTFFFSGWSAVTDEVTIIGELEWNGAIGGECLMTGVAVVILANGEELAAQVDLHVDATGRGSLALTWREAVQRRDGTLLQSSPKALRAIAHGVSGRVFLDRTSGNSRFAIQAA